MGQDSKEKAETKEKILQKIEVNVFPGAEMYVANDNAHINVGVNQSSSNRNNIIQAEKFKNNKKQDYIDNWNSRLFLHTGEHKSIMTLADVFIMPCCEMHKAIQRLKYFCFDPLDVIIEEFAKYEKTSTMLITGVPGIGKSSITSWIANEYKDDDRFIILRFRDWDIEELKKGLLRAICDTLGCKKEELKNKILILDGFDEMKLLNIRAKLLNAFFNDMKDGDNFKCIITSRLAYVDSSHFQNVIELRGFNIDQVDIFYKHIKGSGLTGKEKIGSNLEVLGIPVILYMAVMSDVDINEHYTKPELYNKIFAEQGGIFDKFYDGENEYSKGSQIMRNYENIKKYLKFLREVAFLMFQNNKLNLKIEDCKIPVLEFKEDTVSILEFPIKHLFENTKTNIEFIHKSIYEYFVSEYIFDVLSNEINDTFAIERCAGVLGQLLRSNNLSPEIIEFLKFRVRKDKLTNKKVELINKIFRIMLKYGMTYYTNDRCINVIDCEVKIFANMLEIVHIWDFSDLILDISASSYLKYSSNDTQLNLQGMCLNNKMLRKLDLKKINLQYTRMENAIIEHDNLEGKNLRGIIWKKVSLIGTNLKNADLKNADLENADLSEAKLCNAILINSRLIRTDLIGADLSGANLQNAKLNEASLYGAILLNVNLDGADLDECNINYSIWTDNYLCMILPKLIHTIFKYIIIENKEGNRKKINRQDLFVIK